MKYSEIYKIFHLKQHNTYDKSWLEIQALVQWCKHKSHFFFTRRLIAKKQANSII